MSNEAPHSVNLRIGSTLQYTVRRNTEEEMIIALSPYIAHPDVALWFDLVNGNRDAEAQAVATIQATIPSTVIQTPVVPQQASFAPVPPPSVAPVTAGAVSCQHGAMSAKKGNGAKGEWRGWFCPTPKGTPDQCKPQFVTKGTNEWVTFPA